MAVLATWLQLGIVITQMRGEVALLIVGASN
jgi:hypothetical protein